MKNAVSEVWLLGLVILFIMSFVGFLAVTVSYSRAFKMKDMMLTKIETYSCVTNHQAASSSQGYYNPGTLQSINAYLVASGYKVRGKCAGSSGGTHWIGITSLETVNVVPGSDIISDPTSQKVYYCLSKYPYYYDSGTVKTYSYKVRMFFKLELPVIGDVFTFDVDGETNRITNGCDDSSVIPLSSL